MPLIPRHKKLSWESAKPDRRNPVHKTNRWKVTSENHRKENPLCAVCLKEGIVTPATQVDHIIPLADGGLDVPGNRQSICTPHHNKKTAEENRRRM